jgi:hypothetical protein
LTPRQLSAIFSINNMIEILIKLVEELLVVTLCSWTILGVPIFLHNDNIDTEVNFKINPGKILFFIFVHGPLVWIVSVLDKVARE